MTWEEAKANVSASKTLSDSQKEFRINALSSLERAVAPFESPLPPKKLTEEEKQAAKDFLDELDETYGEKK